ncbi:MAG: uroporphyrinogen-III synthase, partial [Rubrivivax sp.]
MRIVVTRPADQAQALVAALQGRGAQAVALPLIDILPARDVQPLQQAWRELPQLACVMFVSANAVSHFMAHQPPGLSWPATVLAASTGPGTSATLRAHGISPPVLVEPAGAVFDSEALWLQLKARPWAEKQVLVVRGDEGRDWLAAQWQAAGAQVQFVAAYRRQLPALDGNARELLQEALARPAEH